MEICTLVVKDYVNVKFEGLDPITRRKFNDALKFMVPYARHTPAFKLKRWDGKVSFGTVGGATYFNLLERVLPIIDAAGYEIEIDDRRPPFDITFPEITHTIIADRTWPEGHPFAGEPILLRDHQVAAIQRYCDNHQSVQSISTSAGKTIITSVLSLLVEQATGGRTIVVVPSTDLVTQTEEDYRNIGLDVGVFYGDRKEWGNQHVICTWQSLAVFSKRTRNDEVEVPIEEFLEGVVCVMIDEAHTVKGPELRQLLCGPMAHVPIRWGLTGTIPKAECDFLNLLAALGPVVGEVKAKDLQEIGVLANCYVDILQLNDSHESFAEYDAERKFLASDKNRIAWIADFVGVTAQNGNTLILVDRIEMGQALCALIPDSVFIYGQTAKDTRKAEYKSVQSATNKVIIATYGVAAVGINIPRIFSLVLIEPGKSFVRVIQSIGRGLRKAGDKDRVNIYDITSSLKFSKRHLTERKRFYKDAQYPFGVTKIKYL